MDPFTVIGTILAAVLWAYVGYLLGRRSVYKQIQKNVRYIPWIDARTRESHGYQPKSTPYGEYPLPPPKAPSSSSSACVCLQGRLPCTCGREDTQ